MCRSWPVIEVNSVRPGHFLLMERDWCKRVNADKDRSFALMTSSSVNVSPLCGDHCESKLGVPGAAAWEKGCERNVKSAWLVPWPRSLTFERWLRRATVSGDRLSTWPDGCWSPFPSAFTVKSPCRWLRIDDDGRAWRWYGFSGVVSKTVDRPADFRSVQWFLVCFEWHPSFVSIRLGSGIRDSACGPCRLSSRFTFRSSPWANILRCWCSVFINESVSLSSTVVVSQSYGSSGW